MPGIQIVRESAGYAASCRIERTEKRLRPILLGHLVLARQAGFLIHFGNLGKNFPPFSNIILDGGALDFF
jgi:hypothetical protein